MSFKLDVAAKWDVLLGYRNRNVILPSRNMTDENNIRNVLSSYVFHI